MKINNNKIKSLFLLSLVGSGLGKEEKANNQTEILNANQFPTVATNFTDAKITDKGSEQNVLVAGASALFGANTTNGIVRNKCTGGFVVVNANSNTCSSGNDYGGFLTSIFCFPSEPGSVGLSLVTSWDGSVLLGEVSYGYSSRVGIDYNYVSSPTNLQLLPFVPKTTAEGTTNLLPVIALADPNAPGFSACVYGAASGTQCGNIIGIDANLIVPDPHNSGNTWPLHYLGWVDLGTNGLLSEDIGAPVYTETQIGDRTLAQALGHVSWIDNSDPQHQSFFYTPLEQVLTEIENKVDCTYFLLTYNESNAKEYDQLLAQIEIPTKK